MGDAQESASAIAGRLMAPQGSEAPRVVVRPGVEVQANGDLKVVAEWRMPVLSQSLLQAAPNAGEAALTLRAGGDLLLQSGLSTGFRPLPSDGAINTDPSKMVGTSDRAGDIRLVAGADLQSADVLAVRQAATGSVVMGLVKSGEAVPVMVRSTTGRIDIAAAQDIQWLNDRATVYTVGIPVTEQGVTVESALVAAASARPSTRMKPADAGGTPVTDPSSGNGDTTGSALPPSPPVKPGDGIEPTTPPTAQPTDRPTASPTTAPTPAPTQAPTPAPTPAPEVPDPLSAAAYGLQREQLQSGMAETGISPFTHGGQGIALRAGRDVQGLPATVPQRTVTEWAWRGTSQNVAIAWWSRADLFQQGVGTFGGGDISIQAGRDVNQLRASAASSGMGEDPANLGQGLSGRLDVWGGGAVRVEAGRDVVSGQLLASQGALDVRAAGEVRRANWYTPEQGRIDPGLQLVHQSNQVRVQSGRDLTVASVRNQAYLYASEFNRDGSRLMLPAQDGQASLMLQSAGGQVNYLGSEQATRGPAEVDGQRPMASVLPIDVRVLAPQGGVNLSNVTLWSAEADPAKARAWIAAKDQISVDRLEVLALGSAPLPQGQVLNQTEYMAKQRLSTIGADGQALLDQSGRSPVHIWADQGDLILGNAGIHSVRPIEMHAGRDIRIGGPVTVQHQPGQAGQAEEMSVLAAGRDVMVATGVANAGVTIAGPGQMLVRAGRDVDLAQGSGLVSTGNLSNSVLLPAQGSQITVVAGSPEDADDYRAAVRQGFHVLGVSGWEGKLGQAYRLMGGTDDAGTFDKRAPMEQVEALRQLLGASKVDAWIREHVRSLPARADVQEQRQRVALMLGKPVADPAVDAALATLGEGRLQPSWSALSPGQALQALPLLSDVQKTVLVTRIMLKAIGDINAPQRSQVLRQLASDAQLAALAAHVSRSTGESVSRDQVIERFEALPMSRQMPWLNQLLLAELKGSGRIAAQQEGDARWASYGRGYLAINVLFPEADAEGTLRMPRSQVKTLQTADINLLVPRGGANAGELGGGGIKPPNELGVVTVNGGDIQALVGKDFEVNQSRVFTVDQGHLMIWSSQGSIDAGRGAKTVVAAPPPVLTLNAEGQLVFDTSGSFSGSGIAVLGQGNDLDLYAPAGEINAGEAGIRSKGNAFLGADRLVNANDIQVSGSRSGSAAAATAVAPVSVPAPEPVATSAAGAGSQDKDDDRKRRRTRRNLLLEFLGFGNG